MSTKTSSGVPRGIILATLVLVLLTSVAVCRTLASADVMASTKWSNAGASMAIGRRGSNEQIIGVNEQVQRRGQSD
jgi:hypothetical protein